MDQERNGRESSEELEASSTNLDVNSRFTDEDNAGMTPAILPAPVGTVDKHDEETSAELAVPANDVRDYGRPHEHADDAGRTAAGRTTGYIALALSIIGLFILPVILGAAGIIVGFVARRRGTRSLGNWAIGIGIVAVLVGLFITPFY